MYIRIPGLGRILAGRISARDFIYFILFFTIIMETLIAEFHFPTAVRYLNDLALVGTVIILKQRPFILFKDMKCNLISVSVLILFSIVYFSALINLVPINLVIWATRNMFRGIIFLFAIVYCFSVKDLKKVFDKLYILQIVSLILTLYQYFVLHHVQDEIGGIFGYGNGAGVNIFNALLVAYYLNAYINRQENVKKLIFSVLSSFTIAALAEEKMTYILIAMIFIISIMITNSSYRKIIFGIVGIAGLVMGLAIIRNVYPDMYEILTDFEKVIEYGTTTYSAGYRIPRIGAFSVITELFLGKNIVKQLFGLGFGNCETSGYAIFQSDFYKQYGEWNYRWFTHQWTFLECGYMGFFAFLFFFVACIICLMFAKKSISDVGKTFYTTGLLMCFCCVLTIWYNATLKTDVSYLAYFAIAVGLVAVKEDRLN